MELTAEFILYVSDQKKSRDFYSVLLDKEPVLDVEGMTEFALQNNVKLGLMPVNGIKKLLEGVIIDPANGIGIPRCELYLLSSSASDLCSRALTAGAVELSPLLKRTWGDSAAYYSDPDGHIIAIAEKTK